VIAGTLTVASAGRTLFLTSSSGKPSVAIPPAEAQRELERLRAVVDHVDEALVRLLNERAKCAIEIGQVKAILQLPLYSPEREKDVLANVERCSEGPLTDAAVRRLFEQIIDESRRAVREIAGDDQDLK
jgi:chorismate mutase